MPSDIRYFDFDFEHEIITEYKRVGECNGCGACCMTVIRWIVAERGSGHKYPVEGWDDKNGDTLPVPGCKVATAVRKDGKWRFFSDIEITGEPLRCAMLTNDLRCKKHVGKALISSAWPMSPRHVQPFENCSYGFRIIGQWPMAEFKEYPIAR